MCAGCLKAQIRPREKTNSPHGCPYAPSRQPADYYDANIVTNSAFIMVLATLAWGK